MSNSKMLIDATHPEETRVVVQRNGRVEEFDFESAARKLLRGNIYLAKVTRVEPSLQAAFVDYGGNRHGFLAFNEIHPDYYQIPVADRQALIDEEAAAEAELEAAADRRAEAMERRSRQRGHGGPRQPEASEGAGDAATQGAADDDGDTEVEISNIVDVEEDEHIEEIGGEDSEDGNDGGEDEPSETISAAVAGNDDAISEPVEGQIDKADAETDTADADEPGAAQDSDDQGVTDGESDDEAEAAESLGPAGDTSAPDGIAEATASGQSNTNGGGDLLEEVPIRPRRRPRSYKIQEVIKRRQVILVQVVKEERGNKGAALTTYLSLAGRYTVLMPNTARGGGISRKITNPQDRKRLKSIAQELDVPEGMGLIIRTAGAARTKQEIKRDFEYLLRLWESVRDLTLQSTAPSLVYEEGDLIKRSIRDLYNKDVEEVVVAGDSGYREAADFMHMLLPSHSKNVIQYNEPTPLFARYGVERQLNAMFSPQVTLRSGGYIVINQTEALVAIDVNSGKSTREFSIEETALATNLEAADEIARQLKLRDLAGLIVIDFIDMEEKRNNRAVERRLKDALRHDRARIQLGRISHFGLMEMSRQRLRTGVLEGSTSQCAHCQGTGIIRSTESVALAVLRGLEDAITAGANAPLVATTTPTVALYILNSKRAYISDMETRHNYPVTVLGSDRIHGANFTIERGQATAQPVRRPERAAVNMDWGFEGEGDEEAPSFEGAEIRDVDVEVDMANGGGRERPQGRGDRDGEEDGGRRGRRRRRRRGGRRGERSERGEEGRRPPFATADSSEFRTDDEGGQPADDTGDDSGHEESAEAFEDAASPREAAEGEEGAERKRRRRRGRRGGRRSREREAGGTAGGEPRNVNDDANDQDVDEETEVVAPGFEPQPDLDLDDASTAGAAEQPSRAPRRGGQRRRRPERIWDAAGDTDESARQDERPGSDIGPSRAVVSETVPAGGRSSGDDAVAPAPAGPPPTRRHESGSSEPRIERVVVKPGHVGEDAGEPQPPAQRRGWWQRKFGGE